MKSKYISFEALSDSFTVDEYGNLFRKSRPYSNSLNVNKNGVVLWDKSMYNYHRLSYCLQKKKDLPGNVEISHIDGDRTNNKLSNLKATQIISGRPARDDDKWYK
jgi:hypothetical protein